MSKSAFKKDIMVALQKAAFKNHIQNDRYYNFLREDT